MKLTTAGVARLKLPAGKAEHIEWDDELPRFGLRLREGSPPRYVVQYRLGRKQRRMKIGSPATLDANSARKAARKLLGKVDNGDDPQNERKDKRARAELTLRAMADRYLEHHAELVRTGRRRQRSYDELRRRLLTTWAPLAACGLHEIEQRDVAAQLDDIERRGAPFAAINARAALSALYTWAMSRGFVDRNPVVATRAPEVTRSRDRVLSDAELVGIWKACRDDDHGRIVRLLMLTGQRRQEIGDLAFGELDFEARSWLLPSARSKNKRAHLVPLSNAALHILRGVPQRLGTDFVFGRDAQAGFSNWSYSKRWLDARIEAARGPKAMPGWTLHDIRRTVATGMAGIGIAPHIIEATLNHQSGSKAGIAGIYNRQAYEREKRQALDLWAAHLEDLVASRKGTVTVLRKA